MIKSATLFLLACSFSVNASHVVSGTFEATQSCPAYISKNKKTNPEHLMVRPTYHYPLKEINKSPPDWVRIELPESHNTLRWVNANCGITEYNQRDTNRCSADAGRADSYVLALSSQPGFCQTYGYEAGKPECSKLSPNSYQATHLTLHGLWPNQDACGQRYGFCGVNPRANHCDYSPLNLSPAVAEQLKQLMPSYHYGSCLERHEWNKHGSCQILMPDDYFTLAMRLTTEADQSVFGQYLTHHKGEVVKLATLRELIATSFGKNNEDKLYLGCKNGVLVDIFIQLPPLIPFNESLNVLINKAPAYPEHDSCSSNVILSNFSKESWF
ncbi:ribonuclease T2 family protein [Legionella fallonii]|uniref:Putative Enterobacter ribonuclease n=1 Tax=Legionella fallonii LLAP-10 TaxID=1212491 RepID=A0A098G8V7_9GAMM|nr:ribonuclease T [Legionella fallonii]CEG58908.1 putative Enterobacter ribonuclease [Legionella fallonii LLAP-10]